jgi:hypothetical protein
VAHPAYNRCRIPHPETQLSPSTPAFRPSASALAGLATLLTLGLAAGSGCSSRGTPPPAPAPPTPPQVASTVPAARATGVLYDTDVAVVFATPMNAATLTTSNVFLKQDTRRIPISLAWNAAQLTLKVIPQVALELQRTYTVEFSANVLAEDGTSFGPDGWFFQFTTNSLRRPLTPRPAPGTTGESPFVLLSWDSTETGHGAISYQVWAGSDSAAVAVRSGTALATISRASYLPVARWPLEGTTFWAVTVLNGSTGEQLLGDVQRFTTLAASTPMDSIAIPASDYGWNSQAANQQFPSQNCLQDSIVSLPGFQAWFQFSFAALPADVHLAEARLEASVFDQNIPRITTGQMQLWSSAQGWLHPCKPGLNFLSDLPKLDRQMAPVRGVGGARIVYSSDLLAAHVEASVRRGGFYGYMFASQQRVAYVTPHLGNPARAPYLKLYYFRTSPRPAASVAP